MSADGSAPFLPLVGKTLRGADLFCGAGGFSTGAARAVTELGGAIDLVLVNHWDIAIQTILRNHPGARAYCASMENVRPQAVVPMSSLDFLLAAPSCVYFSRARGAGTVHDQQRMDPWHVVRWCTELRVKRLMVENVPEFMQWGPCDPRSGRPIKSRRGEYFEAWIAALKAIGFRVKYRVVCCADFGDATTRERFILIGASDRKPLRWAEPMYSKAGGTDLFGSTLPWRAAAEVIDWSVPGKSIFTRKKPLVEKTLARLLAGAKRENWPRQHIEALQALIDGREPRLDVTEDEAHEIAARLGADLALVMATGAGGAARGIGEPLPTVTAGGEGGARPHFAYPILCPYYGGGSGLSGRGVHEPLDTITTKARFGLARPFLVPNFGERPGQEPRTHSIDNPVPTITASGHIQLAQPALIGFRVEILYRMLLNGELARAMSFDDEGHLYDFAGSPADITKQIGNAVPGRTAKAHAKALLEVL